MSDLLSFLSGGLIGGFVGAFLGGFAKFFWENWLPSQVTWRRQQRIDREKFLAQFRDPAMRAVTELQDRIYALVKRSENLQYLLETGQEDYYATSTAFLVAQFFAWVEILRRKAAMLDYGEFVRRLDAVVNAFSSGGPELQIFRLQQREIGERMIVPITNQLDDYRSLGYAEFIELIKQDKHHIPPWLSHLEKNVHDTLASLPEDKLVRIQHDLIDLMDFLDPDARWVSKDKRTKI